MSVIPPYNCTHSVTEKELSDCLEYHGDHLRYTSQQTKDIILAVRIIFMLVILVTNGVAVILYVVDKSLRTPYNVHILSILIADLCAGLFALPAAMLIHAPHVQGDAMCKTSAFWLTLIEAADVYSMVLIAAEKHLRLVFKPTLQRTLTQTAFYVTLVWAASLLYSIKEVFAYESHVETHWDENKAIYHTECRIPPHRTTLNKVYVIFDALLLFCLPLIAICTCYAHITRSLMRRSLQEAGIVQKKRAVKLHMTVVAMFFCTAVGLHVLRLYVTFSNHSFKHDSLLNDVLTTVAFSDFWINPLLYCFFNTNFQSSWVQLCKRGRNTGVVTPAECSIDLPNISRQKPTTANLYTVTT